MKQVTAVVLAGSRPGRDAFADAHGTDLKALIPVGGMPMVRRPVEALLGSERVARVRVLAQQSERIAAVLPEDERLSVGPSGDTIATTLQALCDDPSVEWPLLVTTADHALLDGAMIEDFVSRANGADVAIGLVERKPLTARLPQTKRTWIKLRGGAYSGANLFLLAGPQVAPALQLWRSVEQDRKKAWKLLGLMGPLTLVAAVLRLRSLHQLLGSVSKRLGIEVRAVELSNPLAAVDVDKAEDLKLVEAILAGRA